MTGQLSGHPFTLTAGTVVVTDDNDDDDFDVDYENDDDNKPALWSPFCPYFYCCCF